MIDIGVDIIGMVKINTKALFKEIIEKFTKYWPGSSYLALQIKPTVSGGRPHIAIGYRYNTHMVLFLIVK